MEKTALVWKQINQTTSQRTKDIIKVETTAVSRAAIVLLFVYNNRRYILRVSFVNCCAI